MPPKSVYCYKTQRECSYISTQV